MHLCRFSFKFILKTRIVYFLVYNCRSFPKEEQLYLNHYVLKLIANAVLNSLKYVQTTIFILHTVKKLGNPSFEREDEEVSNAIALCCSILHIA